MRTKINKFCKEHNISFEVDGSFAWGWEFHLEAPSGYVFSNYQLHYADYYTPEEIPIKEGLEWVWDTISGGIEKCTEANCEICQ